MLDENLPTFYVKPTSDDPLSSTIYLSQSGSELQPEYILRHPDPNIPQSKNCYAVALYDSYNPEVLYAEVLVQPEWTQPTLSQAETRAQNGIPPPPVPIVPNAFTIQLYNPDQQVVIRQIPGTWNTSAHWEFEMPQHSFRTPSTSALDRSQSDPAISAVTPKIAFKWKKDGKLSKDISCFLAGKSTDGKRNKEPDITVAMFKESKHPRLTLYEPNMHRVEVEDAKGLEVVLLLGASVIRDIFFNANREMFNIGSPTTTPNKRKNSGPILAAGKTSASPPVLSVAPHPTRVSTAQIPPLQASRPPAPDPQAQWAIEAETARLKAMVEAEAKAHERRDKEEQKRIKKMVEQEEKEQRKREAEVAKETERLRKQYGVPASVPQFQVTPPLPHRPHSTSQPPQNYRPPQQQQQQQQQTFSQPFSQPFSLFHSAPHSRPDPVQRPLSTPSGIPPQPPSHQQQQQQASQATLGTWLGASAPGSRWHSGGGGQQNAPYLQAPGNGTASSSGFFGLGGKKMQKKRSVYF